MVFCFAKRQITRFALKSGKSPHEPIGQNAPKALLLEIERRLRRVKDIAIEPQLIALEREEEIRLQTETTPQTYYYRMKALDNINKLYADIKKCNPNATKKIGIPLRVFLFEQRQAGCLEGVRLDTIEKFCSLYDHARHSPKIFAANEYARFNDILRLLQNHIQVRELKTSSYSPVTPDHRPNISYKKHQTSVFVGMPTATTTANTAATMQSHNLGWAESRGGVKPSDKGGAKMSDASRSTPDRDQMQNIKKDV